MTTPAPSAAKIAAVPKSEWSPPVAPPMNMGPINKPSKSQKRAFLAGPASGKGFRRSFRCKTELRENDGEWSCPKKMVPRYSTLTGRRCCVKDTSSKKAKQEISGVSRTVYVSSDGRKYYRKSGRRVFLTKRKSSPARKRKSPARKTKKTTSKGRKIHTGARGGKYYITKGRKVYV